MGMRVLIWRWVATRTEVSEKWTMELLFVVNPRSWQAEDAARSRTAKLENATDSR